MKSNDNIHEIIDRIYDSAVEPEKWPELLNSLAIFIQETDQDDKKVSLSGESVTTHQLSGALQHVPSLVGASSNEQNGHQDVLKKHFVRALNVAQKLVKHDEQYEVVLNLLDQMPVGLFIVDRQGQLQEQNEQAHGAVNERRCLRVKDGKLMAYRREDSIALRRCIEMAGSGGERDHVLTIECAQGGAIVLLITPLMVASSDGVAIFVSLGNSDLLPNAKYLAQLYQLTERESEIATDLVLGLSIKEIAEKSEVRESTVRNQVKSVFAKTGTKRQAELVALVLKGPAWYLPKAGNIADSGIKGVAEFGLGLPDFKSGKKSYFALDGRKMAYREFGVGDGIPLVYGHSALGSSNEIALDGHYIARKLGFRLLIPDRPGYGHSDPSPYMGTMSWARDLERLLDHLGIGEFHYVGSNLGGFYGLAIADYFQNRLGSVSLVSTGLPVNVERAAKKSVPIYRLLSKVAINFPKTLPMFMNIMIRGIKKNPGRFLKMLSVNMIDKDRSILLSDYYTARLHESFVDQHRATQTLTAELQMLLHDWDWDFDIRRIVSPVFQWHGKLDGYVPLESAQLLADRLQEQIENSQARGSTDANEFSAFELNVINDGGHFIIFYQWEQILEKIAAMH